LPIEGSGDGDMPKGEKDEGEDKDAVDEGPMPKPLCRGKMP